MGRSKDKHIDDVTQVIRISVEAYKKLKEISKTESKEKGKNVPMIDIFDRMIETVEMLASGTPVYLAEDKVFFTLPEARGFSILQSVVSRKPVQNAKIAVIIGEDESR